MTLVSLERRLATLEALVAVRRDSGGVSLPRGSSTLAQLHNLKERTWRIANRLEAAGNFQTALAFLRAIFEFLEFEAKLANEIHPSQTNIVNINLSADTAKKMAEAYLESYKIIPGEANEPQ